MTKDKLLQLFQGFNAHVNHTCESNDGASYKYGAKMFIDYLDDEGALETETTATDWQPNWEQIAKVDELVASWKK